MPTLIPLPVATTFPFGTAGKGVVWDCSDDRPSGSSGTISGGNGEVSDEVDIDRARPLRRGDSMLERILATSGDMMTSETGRGLVVRCMAIFKDEGG